MMVANSRYPAGRKTFICAPALQHPREWVAQGNSAKSLQYFKALQIRDIT
jgi:hypothetical protein